MVKTPITCPYCKVDNCYSLPQIGMGVCLNCWKTLPEQILDEGRKVIEVVKVLDGDDPLSLVQYLAPCPPFTHPLTNCETSSA
jgi:DNA-directed RNA polymerase subunit RPC12/RpoP